MFKLKSLVVAAVAAVSLLSSAAIASAESAMERIIRDGKLVIAVQTQGPPVSFVDRNGERTGLVVELAQMMADDMGVELVVKDYDWKGLIPALVSGKADMIAADMTPTAKRHMQILFSEPVFFSEIVAFSTVDAGFASSADMNKAEVNVGATQASTFADATKHFLPEATLKEYAGGTAQTIQSLLSGRIDGGVSDRAALASHLKEFPELVVLEPSLNREPLGFAVRPDSMHLLHAVNNYMRLIRYDGRLDEKLDYWWNSLDWEAKHK